MPRQKPLFLRHATAEIQRHVAKHTTAPLSCLAVVSVLRTHASYPEAFAGLVTALVFKTGEASEKALGGFDSHPLPLIPGSTPKERSTVTVFPRSGSQWPHGENQIVSCCASPRKTNSPLSTNLRLERFQLNLACHRLPLVHRATLKFPDTLFRDPKTIGERL